MNLKVASLNIWSLYVAKDRRARIEALANYLLDESVDLDVIGLQELWIRRDYEWLVNSLSSRYPYAYYYKSGVMGSGLATFSKFPIQETLFHQYRLNGHPQRFWHGDWWGGKGVGLARIDVGNGLTVNFYNTHLHAEYDKNNMEYLGHRLAQSQELLQFVQMSSARRGSGYMNILVGDLNCMPDDLAYETFFKRDILTCSGLIDAAWEHAIQNNTLPAPTFNQPANTFTKPDSKSQRIDYIFYEAACAGKLVGCKVLDEDRLALNGKVSLSDHSLIWADFEISNEPNGTWTAPVPTDSFVSPYRSKDELVADINRITGVLQRNLARSTSDQKVHAGMAAGQFSIFLGASIAIGSFVVFAELSVAIILAGLILIPPFLAGATISMMLCAVTCSVEKSTLQSFLMDWHLRLVEAETTAQTQLIDQDVSALKAGPSVELAVTKGGRPRSPLFTEPLDEKVSTLPIPDSSDVQIQPQLTS